MSKLSIIFLVIKGALIGFFFSFQGYSRLMYIFTFEKKLLEIVYVDCNRILRLRLCKFVMDRHIYIYKFLMDCYCLIYCGLYFAHEIVSYLSQSSLHNSNVLSSSIEHISCAFHQNPMRNDYFGCRWLAP